MGKTLTIINKAPRDIWVEWWTVGGGFKIVGYTIKANSQGNMSKEAVWYDVIITDQGKQYKAVYYGGANATWTFTGDQILQHAGYSSEPTSKGIVAENGTLAIPLDNETVQTVINFVKALDYKPEPQKE